MNLATLQRAHCLGLGGVGVSAVARLLRRRGVIVSGSDLQSSFFTADAAADGVTLFPSEAASNVTPDIQLIIYSDACPADHIERVTAAQLGIPQVNFAEVLSWLMATANRGIAIAGTNGKSTTTALLGLMLEAADLNPTVFIGSRVPGFAGNIRVGGEAFFVAEADEYRDHFLALHPSTTVITNIEHDHLDFFPTVAAMTASFRKLVQQTHPQGHIIINLDDPISYNEFIHDPRIVTYGTSPSADFQIVSVRLLPGVQELEVAWRKQALGTWTLHLPGEFNVMNTAAAATTALVAGAEATKLAKVVGEFRGIWRRFEVLNPGAAITVISDYAHHPTSIKGIIRGAKEFYPGRRLLVAFQPHHHNRLTGLFHHFTRSFVGADELILCEVYAVPGRELHGAAEKTSLDLKAEVHHSSVHYGSTPAATEKIIRQLAKPGDVVIIMGAGDIWEIGPHLAADYV